MGRGVQALQTVSGVTLGAEDCPNTLPPPRGQQLAAGSSRAMPPMATLRSLGHVLRDFRAFVPFCPASKCHPWGDQENKILATLLGHTSSRDNRLKSTSGQDRVRSSGVEGYRGQHEAPLLPNLLPLDSQARRPRTQEAGPPHPECQDGCPRGDPHSPLRVQRPLLPPLH